MLQELAEGLWHHEFDLWTWGIHFPGRMVVARLDTGKLWVHSPIPINDALAAELDRLGEVAHIVAPNGFHHLHVASAAARYPRATQWGVSALVDKRPDLKFDALLEATPPSAWRDEIDQLRIAGAPKLDEVVFFHRASRTLIVTDLVFNLHHYRGFLSGLVFRLVGAHKRLATSRLAQSMFSDRLAACDSFQRILAWNFDRLVMAHGDIITSDAKPALGAALRWNKMYQFRALPTS